MDVWWRWLLLMYAVAAMVFVLVSARDVRRFPEEPAQKWWFVVPGALVSSSALLFLLGSRLSGIGAMAAAVFAAAALSASDLARHRRRWRDWHHPGWRTTRW